MLRFDILAQRLLFLTWRRHCSKYLKNHHTSENIKPTNHLPLYTLPLRIATTWLVIFINHLLQFIILHSLENFTFRLIQVIRAEFSQCRPYRYQEDVQWIRWIQFLKLFTECSGIFRTFPETYIRFNFSLLMAIFIRFILKRIRYFDRTIIGVVKEISVFFIGTV